MFFDKITIIPESDYQVFMKDFKNEIKDTKDLPYLAVAISTKSEGLWSHDKYFLEQNKVKVFTNIDMLNIMRD